MNQLLANNKLVSPIYRTDVFTSTKILELCGHNTAKVVVLTDDHVGPLYAQPLCNSLAGQSAVVHVITIPAGENSKNRTTKAAIEDELFANGCGRDTIIIALGGGVICDLAGFVAATYCRGIPVIYVPTSLLAMVDAAIGGKTGINTAFGKNTLGTFTHPRAIFIDTHFLTTLPDIEYVGACSEIIKHALIYDAHYFDMIELGLHRFFVRDLDYVGALVEKSCVIKAAIVADDQKEADKREICNFGHTVGHALEWASEYHLSHGHAVALGMLAEASISNKMGYLSDNEIVRIRNVVTPILKPLSTTIVLNVDDVLRALQYDKKNRNNKVRMVMLNGIGSVVVEHGAYAHAIEASIIQQAVVEILSIMECRLV